METASTSLRLIAANATLLEALAAVIAILLFIWAIMRFFGHYIYSLSGWLKQKFTGDQSVPHTKITFVLNSRRTLWNMGQRGTNPAMQILTSWYVTNASRVPIRVLGAGLIKPNPRGRTCTTSVDIIEHGTNWARGGMDKEILPGQTEVVEANFFLDSQLRKENSVLKMRMYIVDQYGRRHPTPKIKLQYKFPSAETY